MEKKEISDRRGWKIERSREPYCFFGGQITRYYFTNGVFFVKPHITTHFWISFVVKLGNFCEFNFYLMSPLLWKCTMKWNTVFQLILIYIGIWKRTEIRFKTLWCNFSIEFALLFGVDWYTMAVIWARCELIL